MARRERGTGGLSFDKRNGVWVGSVRLNSYTPSGRQRVRKVSAKDKGVARAKLTALRREVEAANGDLPTTTPTVGEWLETWLENYARTETKPSTFKGYVGSTERYLKPTLGRIRLDKLRPSNVKAMHRHMMEPEPSGLGLSPTTATQAHAILSRALTVAIREGLTTHNAARDAGRPRKKWVEQDFLTADEARHFLQFHAKRPYVARYALGLITGARQGECLGLQCEDVTIHRDNAGRVTGGVVLFEWGLQRVPYEHGCPAWAKCGKRFAKQCPQRRVYIPADQEHVHVAGNLYLLRPKTAMSYREVAIPALLAEVLSRVKLSRDNGFMFTRAMIGREPEDLPVDSRMDYGTWKQWLKEAGLPDVRVHSMRHTTATLLAGMTDDSTRMSILGHTNAATTRGYTHRDLSLQARAMQQLGNTLDWTSGDAEL